MEGWLAGPERLAIIESALEERGLRLADFDDSRRVVGELRVIPDRAVYGMLERLVHTPGDLVDLVEATTATPQGALELAMLASTDVGDAMARACRYHAFWTTTTWVDQEEDKGVMRFVARSKSERQPGRDIAIAALLLLVVVHLQRGGAELLPTARVSVRWKPSSPGSDVRDRLGIDTRFGAPQDCIELTSDALDKPMPLAFEPFLEFFQRDIDETLAEMRARQSVVAQVAPTIAAALPGGEPSIGQVARRLGLSTRSLQRRLAEENTTFTDVLESLRYQLATKALLRHELTVGEVAYAIGFSRPAAFIRAFRRWSGQTPGAWRRANRHA